MFAAWANFYTLLGEASASLIGLLFVVSTLTAGLEVPRGSRATGVFLTPAVFCFATVLALSPAALAPGLPAGGDRALAATVAAVGVLNLASVTRSLFRWSEPLHWSDPWCYGVVPALTYLGLGVAAAAPDPAIAARGVGAGAIALLLLGVRNAWDLVTSLAARRREALSRDSKS